jgi:single-strand selective monofunctional uracil DNA glycosylase
MKMDDIIEALLKELQPLRFGPPVTHVYNPLQYAQKSYKAYLKLYGRRPKEVVLLGMNPGPWGMAQTGIPFGEVSAVKRWLRIEAPVGSPRSTHPKRPVLGFECPRREVSGRRFWGWARDVFGTPERFFKRFFVSNYCPLLFIESSGRNRTPNQLTRAEQKPLFEACDRALRRTIEWLKPRYVVGVGNFAKERALEVLDDLDVIIGSVTHPSPANPKANKGWDPLATQALKDLGIHL